jgi:quinol monooxygenase YgiN
MMSPSPSWLLLYKLRRRARVASASDIRAAAAARARGSAGYLSSCLLIARRRRTTQQRPAQAADSGRPSARRRAVRGLMVPAMRALSRPLLARCTPPIPHVIGCYPGSSRFLRPLRQVTTAVTLVGTVGAAAQHLVTPAQAQEAQAGSSATGRWSWHGGGSAVPAGVAAAEQPIVLLAKLRVKPEKCAEFLAFVTALNQAEQAAKPGTLNFTLNQHPADPNAFTWVEVYSNDAAWNAHLDFQSATPELAAEFARWTDRTIALDGRSQPAYRSVPASI